jgi:hypothetical protein
MPANTGIQGKRGSQAGMDDGGIALILVAFHSDPSFVIIFYFGHNQDASADA